MSLAQIILYHNIGIELSYPQPEEQGKAGGVKTMSAEQIREAREAAKTAMQREQISAEQAASDERKAPLAAKYGDV